MLSCWPGLIWHSHLSVTHDQGLKAPQCPASLDSTLGRLLSLFQNILSCSQSDTEFRWTSPRCRGRRWRWRYAHCTVRHIRSGTQLPWRHSTAHRGRHLVQWFRKHPAHLSSPHRCVVPTTLQTYDYFWQRIILIPFFVSSKWCRNVG